MSKYGDVNGLYLNYGHAVSLLQAKGFTREGALQLLDGKLPSDPSDLARLRALAGPGGGPYTHPGGVNLGSNIHRVGDVNGDGIIAILIGLLQPAGIIDGTSNAHGFTGGVFVGFRGGVNLVLGDGSVRSLNFSRGTESLFGDGSVRSFGDGSVRF